MKLHVVYDREGEILGAAQIDPDASLRARPQPNEQAGHRAADVYVPNEYRHYDLPALCQRLRVDVGGKLPDLKPKS